MDIASHFEPIQRRLDSLEKRERHMVIGGSIALLVIFIYLAIIDPIFATLNTERLRYQSQREMLVWMQDAANEVRSLQSSGASNASRFANRSVSSLVELSATSSGVKGFITKQESDRNGVKVQLDKADFDRVIVWINDMQQKYAILASKIVVEPGKEAGTVDVRVTLERNES